MTYTPNDLRAHIAGCSVEEIEAHDDFVTADEEALYAAGQPHLDPEDRDFIAYVDVLHADAPVVVGYGGDHRRIIPGAFGW